MGVYTVCDEVNTGYNGLQGALLGLGFYSEAIGLSFYRVVSIF